MTGVAVRQVDIAADDIWRNGGVDRFEYVETNSDGDEIGIVDGITGGVINRNSLSELKHCGTINYEYSPNVGWIDKWIRVYLVRKSLIAGVTIRELLGTFITTTPQLQLVNKSMKYSIKMYSTLLKLRNVRTETTFNLEAGANIVGAVEQMCIAAGLKVNTTPSTAVLAAPYTKEVDVTHLDIVNELLSMANYSSVGVDVYGNAIIEPYIDPASRAPSWTFSDDEDGVYFPNIGKEQDIFDIPNRVTIFASDVSGWDSCTVTNDDPNDPFSTVSRGMVIDKVIKLDYLEPQAQMQTRALNYLSSVKMKIRAYTFSHLLVPVHEGDTVVFQNNTLGENQLVSVHTMDIQLIPGAQVDSRVRWFSNV